jgi:hypothetical protein
MSDDLSEIKKLRRGWDGYGAAAPSPAVIKTVEHFVNMLNVSQCEIGALSDGALSLEFYNDDTDDMEGILDFNIDGSLMYAFDGSDTLKDEATGPTKKRAMIDLETTSLEPDAGIWEIGYWEIGSDHQDVEGENAHNGGFIMNPYDQLRIVDEDTLIWLSVNSDGWPDAVKAFPTLPPTEELLYNFQQDFIAQGFDEVWCKGADADFVWMRSIFRQYDMALPWHYQNQCCMRSFLNTFPEFKQTWTPNQGHSGMFDARTQAVVVEKILKHVGRY